MPDYDGKFILELARDARPGTGFWHHILEADTVEEIRSTQQVSGPPGEISQNDYSGERRGGHTVTDTETGENLPGRIYALTRN